MKWIGQHIWSFISRFRNKVYLEDIDEITQEHSVMVGPDGILTKSVHPSERSRLQVRNDEGVTIEAGSPLYSKGEIGGSERILVGVCRSNDSSKMPCIGIAETQLTTTGDTKDGFAISQGVYNTNISGFTGLTVNDILYIQNDGTLSQYKPQYEVNKIQNVGVVLKTNGTICQGLLVSAIGRTNDTPNLDNGRIFIGNNVNRAATIALDSVTVGNVNKVKQQFNLSFVDDVGTSEHWLSWRDQYEASSIGGDLVDTNYLVPANGRVVAVYIRFGFVSNGTRTVKVYSQNAGIFQNQVLQEQEASTILGSDDFEVFAFYFDNTEHFQAGDSIKISVQDSNDLGNTATYHVTAVLEFDYTQMGRTTTGELA